MWKAFTTLSNERIVGVIDMSTWKGTFGVKLVFLKIKKIQHAHMHTKKTLPPVKWIQSTFACFLNHCHTHLKLFHKPTLEVT